MAPALTQDSQPELLLPYLTTPPYTPSPPSSLVAPTSASSCTTTSSTSPPRSSCTNMEVPPYGGHELSPAAAPPLNTHTSSDAINLAANHQNYKIGNFDDSNSIDQRLVSTEPTPPHSTDSSAPLSPLPEKSHGPLSPLQRDKISGSPAPLDRAPTHLCPLSASNHNRSLKLVQNLPEEEPMPCSFTFVRDDLGSVSSASQSSAPFGLLSPNSPDKTEALPSSSSADTQQVPTHELDPSAISNSTVAPNSRVSVSVTAAATAAVAEVAVVSDTPVVVTASGSGVDSTATCTTGVAVVSKALCAKPRPVVGVSSSSGGAPLEESPAMGCSVPQVDSRVGSLCSAPQPNDTPPPPYTTPSLSKMTATSGIFDDGILSTLPDECFRTLDHLVWANPELLNEISNCPGGSNNAGNGPTTSPADGSANGNNVSSCGGTTASVFSNTSQLMSPNVGAITAGGLPATNTNSLASFAPSQPCAVVVPTVTPVVLPMTPEVEASAILSSLSVRQLRLQKRQAQLLRRARRLTGRGLASSVSSQLSELIKYGRPLLMADVKTSGLSDYKDSKSFNTSNVNSLASSSFHQPPPRYDTAALKSMSTANLISYVREMETRSSDAISQKLSGGDLPTSHLPSVSPKIEDSSKSVCFSENLRYELQTISGEVKAAARLHVEHDSDATESSSGGESCDELDQEYDDDDDVSGHFKPICDRALYRYETTRAVLASRWGWLEAQIADVECKIHRHARAHLRLRHLNRYNTSALPDPPSSARTSTNPALSTRPAYTCVTRTNINGINSGLGINGATSHVKNASASASDSNKPGLANAASDSDVSRKSCNNFNDGNATRLNNDASSKRDATASHGNPSSDTLGPRNYVTDTGGSRPSPKDAASQRAAINDTSAARTSSTESNQEDSCARTKGLRWHRKRRWIRVGNIFEHGRGRGGPREDLLQSDVVKQLVFQPTLGISCDCVAPLQCVMCTTLKARCNLPRSNALYSNSGNNTKSFSNSNISNNSNNNFNSLSQVNGLQSPLKKALSSASHSPSPTHFLRPSLSPLQFTPPRCSGPSSSNLLNLCPQISRIPSDNSSGNASSTDTSARRSEFGCDDPVAPGTTLLCKNAWYPRVAASSRVGLGVKRPQLLHERLASRDLGHHPLLSSNAEIPLSVRTESVLKSSSWCGKVATLVAERADAASPSGAQASSLPGYRRGFTSSSSRRHKSKNHHSSNRGHRRHDAAADDELYTPHKSSAKKKKKSKDKMKQRSKDRDEKRKEKKKKAFKRKEKLEHKGRLMLRLRKSSVTGELVATPSSLPDSAQLYTNDHQTSGEGGRGRGRHSLPFIQDDVSSVQSSSRASSPSLPPHSPVESRSVMQTRYFSNDARPLSRNTTTRPQSPADTSLGSNACSPSPGAPRTPAPNSFVTGSRSRNNKPHVTLDRCVSSCAESGATPGLAARRATVHSSISTAFNSSTNATGPLSAPVLYPASPAAASTAGSGATVTPAAAAAVALRIKQGAASYDIDNIVIPYNMASVTRVEHIEYKEIVTPKWREIEEPQPLLLDQTSCPVLEEDVCDTTVIARHEKSEELERLRFAAHLTTGGTRHGGNARVRQRSALTSATTAAGSVSTGTNTPENPLSPHVDVSDLATPPATPLALSEDSNHSSVIAQNPGVSTEGASTAATSDTAAVPRGDGNQDIDDAVVPSNDADKAQGSCRANGEGASKMRDAEEESQGTNVSIAMDAEMTASDFSSTSASVHPVPEGSQDLASNITINTAPVSTTTSATANISSSGSAVSMSAIPTVATSFTIGASQNVPLLVSGPRKLRQTTTRLRTNSNNSSVNFNEDEGSAREVSPYPIRKFPLSDAQFACMVQENNEVVPYPNLAANHPLLRSMDYDDVGEPSSDEHEHEDEAGETQAGRKRKHYESSVPSPFTEADSKKRQKRISPNIVVQDASDDSGLGITSAMSNLPVQPLGVKSSRRLEESQFRSGRNSYSAVKKTSSLVTFKENLKKTNEGECGSEGRSSPLSEVTDSAAEDEMTGDLSDGGKPPDWTISATANSSGHCVIQVLRH